MTAPGPRTYHVLIVDDDALVLEMLGEVLADAGHEVRTASSATRGIEMARAAAPDLILMDEHIPDLNGVQAVERLKAEPATRRIPVVALSGTPAPERLMRAGCLGYIPKPITDVRAFQATIRGFLEATVGRPGRPARSG